MPKESEVLIVDEQSLNERIYVIRGQQVMLDFDLAEIYGYETRYLNLQVKHNINRFPEDFMFQLTKEEYESLMLKISTSKRGGRRKLPNVFTEQGVYQLATVLKGTLAEQQSVAIMRAFRIMRQCISERLLEVPEKELLRLYVKQDLLEKEMGDIKANMITRAHFTDFMKLFDRSIDHEEILIIDGELFKADLAYREIYRKANKSIIVIDNYIDIKTLHHLTSARSGVALTIISDNRGKGLSLSDFFDFNAEYPDKNIHFVVSKDRVHDRYIIVDFGTKDFKVYHCGASSKDAGKRITTITRIKDGDGYKRIVEQLLDGEKLILK